MISRLRSLASALEFYLRTNGEAAVAITNRTKADEARQKQSIRLDAETQEMNREQLALSRRQTAAAETSARVVDGLAAVLGNTTSRLARIEAAMGIREPAEDSVSPTGGEK